MNETKVLINGEEPVVFIKKAFGIGEGGDYEAGYFDLDDPVQKQLRMIKAWITMAMHDALQARTTSGSGG